MPAWTPRFRDRRAAGRLLAEAVASLRLSDPMVLGLPRGGVPVAFEVAQALGAPLDVFVARKLGAPMQRELGIGAIAEGGQRVVDMSIVRALAIREVTIDEIEAVEREELRRRVERYRGGRPLPALAEHDVVLVDDGLATGVTAEAALLALQALGARRLVLAVPVGAPETVARLGQLAEVVALHQPERFQAVGLWYDDFTQTSDEEVDELLRQSSSGSM